MADIRDIYTVETRLDDNMSAGADAATARLARMEAAAKAAAKAAEGLGSTTTDAGTKASVAVDQWDRLAKRHDAVTAAAAQLAAAQKALAAAQTLATRANADQGDGAEQVERVMASLTARVDAASIKLREARIAAEAAAAGQAAWNGEMTSGAPAAARMTAAGVDQARSFRNTSDSSRAAAFEIRNMGVQFVQAISGIASGQPVLLTLIEQGHQLGDVALSSGAGFSALGRAMGGIFSAIVSPIGLAITAVLAVAGAIAVVATHAHTAASETHDFQTAIAGVGRDAELSASSLQKYVTMLTQAGVSRADANAIVTTAVRNPQISDQQIGGIAALTPDVAARTGLSNKQAADELTQAAGGSLDAIKKLDDQIKFLTSDERDNVRLMLEHGDRIGALRLAFGNLSTEVAGFRDKHLTPMQTAFQALGIGWDEFLTRLGNTSAFQSVSSAIIAVTNGLANMLKSASSADISKQIEELKNQAAQEQDYINKAASGGFSDQVSIDRVNTINQRITQLTQKAKEADAAVASIGSGKQDPSQYGPQLPGLGGKTQTDIVNEQTIALNRNNEVLAASVTARAKVRAEQEADVIIQKQGITNDTAIGGIDNQTIFRKQYVANAIKQASDAAVQNSLAINRETAAAQAGAAASSAGAVAMLKAAAAAEAHTQAMTQTGASEKALTQQILARGAAQAALALGTTNVDLQNQVDAAKRVVDAQGLEAEHQAILNNEIIKTTKAATDAAAAMSGPGADKAVAAASAEADATRKAKTELDNYNLTIVQHNDLIVEQDTKQYLQAEIGSLGMADDARQIYLAHIKNEIELKHQLAGRYDELGPKVLAERDANEQLTVSLQNQQNTLSYLSNLFQNAFNTIGDAITQAFVQGQGAAVNWGNVTKAVISQVIKAFLEMSIVNPLLNDLFGGPTRPTLGSVAALGILGGVMGDSGAGIANGPSAFEGAGLGSTLGGAGGSGGIMNLLGLAGLGSQLSSGLGLSGSGGIMSSLGLGNLFGSGGISGILSTPIFGETAAMNATNSALGAMGPGVFGPATPAAVGLPGVTIGSAIGGIGLGFGAGSLLNSLVGGHSTTGMLGSGLGSAAGFGIGTLLGGPLLGALVGGLGGGLFGGMLGPGPANSYSSTSVGLSGGRLSVGGSSQQIAGSTLGATSGDVGTINALLAQNNLLITSLGAFRQVGTNTPGGFQDPSKFPSVGAAFSQFRFSSADAHTNAYLSANGGAGFSDPQSMQTMLTAVQSFVSSVSSTDFADRIDSTLQSAEAMGSTGAQAYLSAVSTFVATTVPSLLKLGSTAGSLNDAITALNTQFGPAIDMAQQLGYKEADLTAARDKAIAAVTQTALDALQQQDVGYAGRYLTAAAAAGQGGVSPQDAALFNFDAKAAAEQATFSKQLTDTFGASYANTQQFADQMAELEQTLAEERLAVQAQFNTASLSQSQSAADAQLAAQLAAEQAATDAVQAAAVKLAQDQTTILRQNAGYQARYLTAAASVGGTSVTPESAALFSFDVNATNERMALSKQLTDAFGQSYGATKDFADEMANLEQALAEERLSIQAQYNTDSSAAAKAAAATQLAQQTDAARQSVTSVVTSIAAYANNLQTGPNSALSPQNQYAFAKNQFNAVSGAASAGDYTSLQQLTGYADTFLNASRAINGSGQGYASDFQRVVDALTAVATTPPDTLTASALTASLQSQTVQLVDALEELGAKLDAIQGQIKQNALAPARIAA